MADYEQALRVDPRFDTCGGKSRGGSPGARPARYDRSEHAADLFLRTARRAVEKAICFDPDLSRLDRQIDDAYKAALAKLDRRGVGPVAG